MTSYYIHRELSELGDPKRHAALARGMSAEIMDVTADHGGTPYTGGGRCLLRGSALGKNVRPLRGVLGLELFQPVSFCKLLCILCSKREDRDAETKPQSKWRKQVKR